MKTSMTTNWRRQQLCEDNSNGDFRTAKAKAMRRDDNFAKVEIKAKERDDEKREWQGIDEFAENEV